MRVNLTPSFVTKAPVPAAGDRTIYWDSERPGFGLMVTAGGHRSYVVQYRTGRRSHRMHLKNGLNLSEARREAKAILGAVAKGGNPLGEKRKAAMAATNSFKSICEEYLEREGGLRRDAKGNRLLSAKGKPIFSKGAKLRSADQRAAILDRHVYPRLGAQQIDDIRRSEVTRMLDKIEDQYGASMADQVLAVVRRVMSWHASRSDDYRSPIVRGMARTSVKELARKRTLSDDELRAVWSAADEHKKPFARMVQFILLTGVRRNEAARMDRSELDGSDWLIPAARFKGKRDFLVPLSNAALAVLARLPVIISPDKGPVFTFDKACGVSNWTIHDLRRTARTLMTRAGVDKDHAERCLGHALAGVRSTYDRHEYYDEKKRVFEALAVQIDRILNPAVNVVQLRAAQEITPA